MGFETDTKRGVLNSYGVRTTNSKFGGNINEAVIKTAQWTFNYNDLPVNAANNLGFVIPANAKIVSARLEILTAFTSTSTTTDLTVGLRTASAVAEDIDDDGFVTAANATQTTIAAKGMITGSGALVGTTIGTSAGELYVAPTVADLLTGKARVIVEYIKEGV